LTNLLVHKFKEEMPTTYEEHFSRIYTNFVHFLRTLEAEIGKESMMDILRKWGDNRGVEMAEKLKKSNFSDFKEYWKSTAASDYFQHTTTTSYPEETDTVLQCEITECLWAKTFQDLNAAELGKIMVCDPDIPMASAMNPKIKLVRTKTLMEGHDCCDHRYVWEE
jgi:hypothetical protein